MNTYSIAQKTENGKLPFQNRWYLILRLEKASKDAKFYRSGIGKYLAPDYMGAAEFEFGAVPAAWTLYREAANAGDLLVSESETLTLSGKPFWILHHKDYSVSDVDKAIVAAARITRLKEPTYFSNFIGPVTRWATLDDISTCFWMVMSSKFDYVCWGLDKDLVNTVLKELSQPEKSPPLTPCGLEAQELGKSTVDERTKIREDRAQRNKLVSESLTLFDRVKVKLPPKHGGTGDFVQATLVGIYDKSFDVLYQGQRLRGIGYHALARDEGDLNDSTT